MILSFVSDNALHRQNFAVQAFYAIRFLSPPPRHVKKLFNLKLLPTVDAGA